MKYNGIELTPITEVQAFEEPREMLVWQHSKDKLPSKKEYISAIVNVDSGIKALCINHTWWNYCAEIPQPKQREMTALEVMEYLHLFQLYLDNGGQGNPMNINLPIINERNASDFKFGIIVYSVGSNENFGNWANSISFWGYINGMSYKFGILKNGEVKEFELPKIEVINE